MRTFSKKLSQKIDHPKNSGCFSAQQALQKGMRLAIGKEQSASQHPAIVAFYLLVDESDGVIADAKFQAFGSPSLIGAAEVACELLLRKNYDQARRIGAELIDQAVRDRTDADAFPPEAAADLNLVLFAIENAAEQCSDIPFAETYVTPPMSLDEDGEVREYPGWVELSTAQKMAVMEEVVSVDIRPYIELDAGGIKLLEFVNDCQLIIGYEGSCTSCHSATGSTLNAIQKILRQKVHPSIVVIPDLSLLR